MEKEEESNWSERVEDFVSSGDTPSAISLLESVVSNLQTSENPKSDLQLAAALSDLSTLYSSQGLSLKSDDIAAKSLLLKHQHQHLQQLSSPARGSKIVNEDRTSPTDVSLFSRDSADGASVRTGNLDQTRGTSDNAGSCDGSLNDDDWEAIADRPPNELLSLQRESEPELPVVETKEQTSETTRRRGRGTFSYKKDELYSDKLTDSSTINDTNDEDTSQVLDGRRKLKAQYGTQHVLVLADFPLSTKTIDLERLLGNFNNSGVLIRWVNDTVALAVFQTPSVALEAFNHVKFPFTVRILDENDILLSSIPPRDLEPPKQRPKTSVLAAQRMIAQGMGMKLPASTTGFGSKELRKQEEERKNRIVSRQKLKDEAWGE